MIRPFFLIALICLLSAQYQCAVTGKDVAKKVGKILNALGQVQPAFEIAGIVYNKLNNIPSDEEQILKYVKGLGPDMQRVLTLGDETFKTSKEILNLMRSSVPQQLLANQMKDISKSLENMDSQFHIALDHQKINKINKNVPAVKVYANSILQLSTSEVNKLIGNIQTHITADSLTNNIGVLELTLILSQDFSNMCNTKKSMNMILYDIYKAIKNTLVTANTISSIAYEILKKIEGPSEALDLTKNIVDNDLVRRENIINTAFKDALQKSSRAIWTCDKKTNNDLDKTWTSLYYPGDLGKIYIIVDTVFSDTKNTMVITGARINRRVVKSQETEIFIEIQQGKLFDNGTIDAKTLEWKNSLSGAKPTRVLFERSTSEFALWAKDFYNMFDDTNPIVLTGLGLMEVLPGRFGVQAIGSPLILPTFSPIRVSEQFITLKSFVIQEKNGQYTQVKTALEMNTKSNPINELHSKVSSDKAPEPDNASKRSTSWVRFQKLNNKNEFVPFLDLSEVVTNPPMPMSGVGLYYKNVDGYAGYVGMELLTFSLDANIPNEVKLSNSRL